MTKLERGLFEAAKERLAWYLEHADLEIWLSIFFDIEVVEDDSKRKK